MNPTTKITIVAKSLFVMAAMLGLLVVFAPPAQAAGVVSTCDEASLNASLSGGGTVTFACDGTITLTSTKQITSNTSLDGSGRTVTISGDNAVQLFDVSGVTFNVNHLTLENGNTTSNGGAIRVIYDGSVTVSNSTLRGNHAGDGGAVYANGSTLTVTGSTFYDNHATDFSGDSEYTGFGGAINAYASDLSVANSTFVQNTAVGGFGSGGAIMGGGLHPVVVLNSTFTLNSAGYGSDIRANQPSPLRVSNSIFSSSGETCHIQSATNTGTNNKVTNGQAANCGAGFSDTPAFGLGSIGDHGGPTQTVPLLPGSVAIDAGDDAVCAAAPVNNLDQRGVARPSGSHCDIGAFEVVQADCESVGSGDWSNPVTWSCPARPSGALPLTGDTVNIAGHNVTLQSDNAEVKNLILSGGGSVDLYGHVLTLHGDLRDNSSNVQPLKDGLADSGSGRISFQGTSDQNVGSDSKTDPTRIGARIEVNEPAGTTLTIAKGVEVTGDLTLNESHAGSMDLKAEMTLRRDLIDNSPDGNALPINSSNSDGRVRFEDQDDTTAADQYIKRATGRFRPVPLPNVIVNKKPGKVLELQKPVEIKGDLTLDVNHDGTVDIEDALILRRHVIDNRPDTKEQDAIRQSADAPDSSKAEVEIGDKDDASSKDQEVKSENGRTKPTTLPNTKIKKASGKIIKTLKPLEIKGDLRLDPDHRGKISLKERLTLRRHVIDNRPDSIEDDPMEQSGDLDTDPTKAEVEIGDKDDASSKDQEVKSENGRTKPTTLPNVRVNKNGTRVLRILTNTHFPKTKIAGTAEQQIEIFATSNIHLVETLQKAKIAQRADPGTLGSRISTSLKNGVRAFAKLFLGKKARFWHGSMDLEVTESDGPVDVVVGDEATPDAVVTVPNDTSTRIEEPVNNSNEVTVENTSTLTTSSNVTINIGSLALVTVPMNTEATIDQPVGGSVLVQNTSDTGGGSLTVSMGGQTITLQPATANVTATSQEVGTPEYKSVTVTLAGTPAGVSLAFAITALPAHGTVYAGNDTTAASCSSVPCVLPGNQVTYLGNANWSGTDSFQFKSYYQGSSSADPAKVTVEVAAVNRAPIISAQTFSIAENSANGTAVGKVAASDPDAGQTLIYAITGGNTGNAFTIDSSSGQMAVNASGVLDYDTTPSFSLTVQVTDNDAAPLSSSATITVNLANANEAPTLNVVTSPQSVKWGNQLAFTASATDPDVPANTLTYSLASHDGSSVPDGATINSVSGAFSWTPTSAQIGSYTFDVMVCDDGSPAQCDRKAVTVNVGKRETALVYSGDTSGAYSDTVTLKATLTDNGGGNQKGTLLEGKAVQCTIGSQSASGTTNSAGVALMSITLNRGAATTTVDCSFSGLGDALYMAFSKSDPFTIGKENAKVRFFGGNPVAVRVNDTTHTSGTFSLSAFVTEVIPDLPDGKGQPGDISKADLTMALVPVGPAGAAFTTTCGTPVVSGTGYDSRKTITCNFTGVPANTYAVQVSVGGSYYDAAMGEDVVGVYDPSSGLVTGAGDFVWPDRNAPDPTHFSITMQYNNSGRNVQGSFMLTRFGADGSVIYRVKSNALSSLSVSKPESTSGWATFAGKATYVAPDLPLGSGNYSFMVYVQDNNEPNMGIDRLWIEIKDKEGNVVSAMSMARPAEVSSVLVDQVLNGNGSVTGSNVFVPHVVGGDLAPTPVPAPTQTPTLVSPTPVPTTSVTPTPQESVTPTPTRTPGPTVTPTPTSTPQPKGPTAKPSATPKLSPTPTATPKPTGTKK